MVFRLDQMVAGVFFGVVLATLGAHRRMIDVVFIMHFRIAVLSRIRAVWAAVHRRDHPCARHRCLDGNGSPRAAWPFSSFEGVCRNFSGLHKLLLGTRGADLSTAKSVV